MDINLLVKVTARAWSLDILALLHKGVPGRQASLLAASGAGRTAFAQSLAHLTELGLLRRNPGHGHPLRPEYLLTPKGERMAAIAADIAGKIEAPIDAKLIRRAWTVPILAVTRRPLHFGDIKRRLGRITDRALSKSLHDLQSRHWMSRTIDERSTPPRPLYRVINTGAGITKAIDLRL